VIPKVRKGANFAKLLSYLYREGLAENHVDPHRVSGNVVGDDPQTLTKQFRWFSQANERVKAPVFHVSLRLPAGEHLTDDQWAEAAQMFLKQMNFIESDSDGYGRHDAPWVALRHADDHIHIVASRVRFDGKAVKVWLDWERSRSAARALERHFGLSSPVEKADTLTTVTKGERLSATRRHVIPERSRLQERVMHARDHCDGTRPGFESALAEVGVGFKANQASTGRMNGYSFSLTDWTDAQGEQVWVTASQLHKSLRWAQLDKDLDARRQELKAATPRFRRPAAPAPINYSFDSKAAGRWREYYHQQEAKQKTVGEAIARAREQRRRVESPAPWDKMSPAAAAFPFTIEQLLAAAAGDNANKSPEQRNQPRPHDPPPPRPDRGRGR
jgi:hypothetical protein